MDDLEPTREKLAQLKQEHRDLDSVIARIEDHYPRDELQLRRLKKRKLQLKDEIVKLEGSLIPDIIA
ncbi:MAG: YdcH family protein [Proteobacteria bacterium]|nr:YdcH family protein [Pseudomonadota bacterium]